MEKRHVTPFQKVLLFLVGSLCNSSDIFIAKIFIAKMEIGVITSIRKPVLYEKYVEDIFTRFNKFQWKIRISTPLYNSKRRKNFFYSN